MIDDLNWNGLQCKRVTEHSNKKVPLCQTKKKVYVVSWEPEGHYQHSNLFCWELEGPYQHSHICSIENQKGTINIQICSVENQKGIIKYVPLRTRRPLSLYKVYGNSALLVLNGTSLNSDSTLLALNWRCKVFMSIIFSSIHFIFTDIAPFFHQSDISWSGSGFDRTLEIIFNNLLALNVSQQKYGSHTQMQWTIIIIFQLKWKMVKPLMISYLGANSSFMIYVSNTIFAFHRSRKNIVMEKNIWAGDLSKFLLHKKITWP